MQVTRLLPANRTQRTRLENNRRVLAELAAKIQAGGFLSTLEMKRRKNAELVITTFNKTGRVI